MSWSFYGLGSESMNCRKHVPSNGRIGLYILDQRVDSCEGMKDIVELRDSRKVK